MGFEIGDDVGGARRHHAGGGDAAGDGNGPNGEGERLPGQLLSLATADVDAIPSVRTVLLKGLDEHGLTFFTNLRSRKGQELAANARAAVVFPWIGLHRQVIVDGAVEPVGAEASDEYFASRPHGAQVAAAASHQSQPVESRPDLEAAFRSVEDRYPDAVPRPEHWGGLRLCPDAIEFWQGRPDRLHDRLRFRNRHDEWNIERLAP